MSRMIPFLMERISINFDIHKLKKIIDLEFVIAEKILIKFQKLHPIYYDFYDKMIENEINLANISKDDKILHVGCGSFPATSILLAKKIGSQIISIDKNLRSVKQAISFVKVSDVADKIKIEHADATQYPVENFDLIILSQGIKPYKELLNHISKLIKDNKRVILRTTSSQNGEIAQNDLFLKDIFKIEKMVVQKQNGLLLSILLLKK